VPFQCASKVGFGPAHNSEDHVGAKVDPRRWILSPGFGMQSGRDGLKWQRQMDCQTLGHYNYAIGSAANGNLLWSERRYRMNFFRSKQ